MKTLAVAAALAFSLFLRSSAPPPSGNQDGCPRLGCSSNGTLVSGLTIDRGAIEAITLPGGAVVTLR